MMVENCQPSEPRDSKKKTQAPSNTDLLTTPERSGVGVQDSTAGLISLLLHLKVLRGGELKEFTIFHSPHIQAQPLHVWKLQPPVGASTHPLHGSSLSLCIMPDRRRAAAEAAPSGGL